MILTEVPYEERYYHRFRVTDGGVDYVQAEAVDVVSLFYDGTNHFGQGAAVFS